MNREWNQETKGKKKKYYKVFVCDLTFSISLQTQAERAGASSGTVNTVMYFCGVWAACGDPQGHPIPRRERAPSQRQPAWTIHPKHTLIF